MWWFSFYSILVLLYYLFIGICIVFENSFLLPLGVTCFVAVGFQIALLIGLQKQIKWLLTGWLLFSVLELTVVFVSIFLYAFIWNHEILDVLSYLTLKVYGLCRVSAFWKNMNRTDVYEAIP